MVGAWTVDGYARGLAFAPGGLMAAGSSRGRARSRSLGTIENPADAGEWSGDLGVTFFATDAGAYSPVGVRPLSNFEAEVYDVAILT